MIHEYNQPAEEYEYFVDRLDLYTMQGTRIDVYLCLHM